jgi:AIR synthase-related protein
MKLDLDRLVSMLGNSNGLSHKQDITSVVERLGIGGNSTIAVGDDCAAIPEPEADSHLLLAIEGFQPAFVSQDPWFAGWCGVMVNLSDIYAMGGRPIAVVDALWAQQDHSFELLMQGMKRASETYRVPVVGGHSNLKSKDSHLAVAVLGRAKQLLTSFDAAPGDQIITAIDMRGAYREPFLNWNCATDAPAERLRGDLALLPELAEAGLCHAAKDISQAGIIGTLMMLLECSGVGANINIESIPMPDGVDPYPWLLSSFPSYGFLLAVKPRYVDAVLQRFADRDIAGSVIGHCDSSDELRLKLGDETRTAWRFAEDSVTGCKPFPPFLNEVSYA